MKFAHFSDVHLGGWREDSLRELGLKAFRQAIEASINEKVDCVLIAGDLFNTSLPSVDVLKEAADILRHVKENGIRTYVIPGSHDYSASGKTMIDVLENSGLLVNVSKLDGNKLRVFTDKSGLKIAGWHGRKGGLEKDEYWDIDMSNVENESGFKVFMFHTLLDEFKPKDLDMIECMSVNMLPKGCSYYAGGHPHRVMQGSYGNGKLTYPGALFPNNFKELEEFKLGGFYLVTLLEKALAENTKENKTENKLDIKWVAAKTIDVDSHFIDADGKSAGEVEEEIVRLAKNTDGKIVTLRIEGMLREGKPSEINHKRVENAFKNAYHLLRNTSKFTSKEVNEISMQSGSVEEIEARMLMDYAEKKKAGNRLDWMNKLIIGLDKDKEDGETNNDFELRVVRDGVRLLGVHEEYEDQEA